MSDIELEGEEIEQLVRKLMDLTGEDAETAIRRAVEEQLERLKAASDPLVGPRRQIARAGGL
jgi:hypothetical protein